METGLTKGEYEALYVVAGTIFGVYCVTIVWLCKDYAAMSMVRIQASREAGALVLRKACWRTT